jgi:hypothetical protein
VASAESNRWAFIAKQTVYVVFQMSDAACLRLRFVYFRQRL